MLHRAFLQSGVLAAVGEAITQPREDKAFGDEDQRAGSFTSLGRGNDPFFPQKGYGIDEMFV